MLGTLYFLTTKLFSPMVVSSTVLRLLQNVRIGRKFPSGIFLISMVSDSYFFVYVCIHSSSFVWQNKIVLTFSYKGKTILLYKNVYLFNFVVYIVLNKV